MSERREIGSTEKRPPGVGSRGVCPSEGEGACEWVSVFINVY